MHEEAPPNGLILYLRELKYLGLLRYIGSVELISCFQFLKVIVNSHSDITCSNNFYLLWKIPCGDEHCWWHCWRVSLLDSISGEMTKLHNVRAYEAGNLIVGTSLSGIAIKKPQASKSLKVMKKLRVVMQMEYLLFQKWLCINGGFYFKICSLM